MVFIPTVRTVGYKDVIGFADFQVSKIGKNQVAVKEALIGDVINEVA